jgi:hypothetical protein
MLEQISSAVARRSLPLLLAMKFRRMNWKRGYAPRLLSRRRLNRVESDIGCLELFHGADAGV